MLVIKKSYIARYILQITQEANDDTSRIHLFRPIRLYSITNNEEPLHTATPEQKEGR